MKSIILAAGMGQRLRPYTDTVPKCMVEICGISLLDAQLDILNSCGINDITVVTGYKAEKVSSPRFATVHNANYENSNMVATLFTALEQIELSGLLIVSYGDIVYEKRVLEALQLTPGGLGVVFDREWERYWRLRMDDPLVDAESFLINANGFITELGKRPESLEAIQGQYIGLMMFSSELTSGLREIYAGMDRSAIYDGKDFNNMYMTSFIQYLIDTGYPVKGIPIDNGWLEIDTAGELEMYRDMERRRELSEFCDVFGHHSE